jgi:signal peptidase II
MQKGQDNGSPEKSLIFLGKDRRKIGLFLISTASVVLLDQLTKLWIRENPTSMELLPGFINFVYSQNPGAVFGLPVNQAFLITTTVVVLIAIIFLLLRYLPLAITLTVISAGLIFGGATGNLIDRLRLGYVIDFIDIRLWGDFHWPAFNFADAAIVIGIFTLFYSLHQTGLFRKVYGHTHKTKN